MVSPFDPRSVFLARHAQHVVLVHFPIALFLTGAAFDLAAQWRHRSALATAAYFNIVGAAVLALPTIVTGIIAWQWQLAGARLKGTLLLHFALGTLSALLIACTAWMRARDREPAILCLPRRLLALELVTVLVVAFTAHVGGVLSGITVVD